MTNKIVVSSAETQTVELSSEEETERNASQAEWDSGADARAMAALRQERNAKLAETDWMATSDYTMSDAWKEYRKKLRELPENTDNPESPTWPTKPS